MIVVAEDPEFIAEAFSAELINKSFWLDGVMSRKKQVVPFVERAFESVNTSCGDGLRHL